MACVDLEGLSPIFKQDKQAIQFLGDHGRGKSTHLIALHQLHPKQPYTQFHPGSPKKLKASAIQFIDSIEHLSVSQRFRLFKNSNVIAFTSHKDLSMECKLAGLQLHTQHISISAETLHQALNKRVEFFRINSATVPEISRASVQKLMLKFSDDVRSMEYFLYDYFKKMEALTNVEL